MSIRICWQLLTNTKSLVVILASSLLLTACNTSTVKTTTVTQVIVDESFIPEEQLLDVGIAIFDPGLDDLDTEEEELTFGDIRMAETFFVSHQLSNTLQSSGNWGVVRVIPHDLSSVDLALKGTILQSDGETMRLYVNVTDSTGRTWIDKEYEEVVSRFSYDPRQSRNGDSFRGLYNRVANDILAYRQRNIDSEQLLTIRSISQLQFARDFAPQVFDEYLEEDRRGQLQLVRLPSSNDPYLTRIDSIRERDNLYVDSLQGFYSDFSKQMQQPYTEYRRISYDEVMKLDRLQKEARIKMITGIGSILVGLAGTQSENATAYYSSPLVLGGGAWLIREAFMARDEAQLHVEALAELGNSLETELAPRTIELQERSVTLSGSVDAQYAQWREILADIYANEIGDLPENNL